MSLLHLAYVISRRRIISNWRMEMVLFVGILLAVSLMSSGMVFSDLLAEAALRRELTQAEPEEANFHIRVYNVLDNSILYRESLDFVEERAEEPLSQYVRDQSRFFETETFFFRGKSQLELEHDLRPRGKVKYVTGLYPERVDETKMQGRWPEPLASARNAPTEPLEVAIDKRGSELIDLGVGDVMEIFPGAGGEDKNPSMEVRIVGVFELAKPDDEYWYDSLDEVTSRRGTWTTVPMFTTEDSILRQVLPRYGGVHTDLTWYFYLDREGITAGDVGPLQRTIRRVERDTLVNLNHSDTFIVLDEVLERYEKQFLRARIPFLLMLFLVTAILVYYLALVGGLVVRFRSNEISMLKSRGSTSLQIGLLAFAEGLFLAVPAIALGPVLALVVSRALGRIFFDTGVNEVPITLSSPAILLGVGGAALAVVVLTVSAIAAARHGIVESHQSGARPPATSILHRYYLDILLLALIGLAWWQIKSRGSFLVRSLQSGELEINYSLLIGPALGLLAAGLLVLRIFPWVVSLLSKAAEPVGPAWLVQGMRRISRDPLVPGMIVVLLMMATALGVIVSAFSSTLERSQRDRALYSAGADLRIEYDRTRSSSGGPVTLPAGTAGVDAASETARLGGLLMSRAFVSQAVSVLAVNADTFSDVAWYRSDFADKQLGGLTKAITHDSNILQDGIELPEDSQSLALWIRPGGHALRSRVTARLRDAQGVYFDVPMGSLDSQGWQRLQARLSPAILLDRTFRRSAEPVRVAPPYQLLSLRISPELRRSAQVAANPLGISRPPAGVLFFGALSVLTREREEVLADFQTTEGWHVIEDYSTPDLFALESTEAVARAGTDRSAAFSWITGGISGVRAIRAGGVEEPIPAVVSPSFLESTGTELGESLTVNVSGISLSVQPVAVAKYFPTLNPNAGPFMVIDLANLSHYANLHGTIPRGQDGEIWVRLDGSNGSSSAALESVRSALESRGLAVTDTHIASEMVTQRVDQPLVNAGWGGLLVLMFLALIVASVSGVTLFSYMDTRERHTEFALLRTLGLSGGQFNGVLWFNVIFVTLCGVGIGTWMGQLIGSSLLPVLEIAEEGARVTPPMVLKTNWGILLASYLVLASVAVGTIIWLSWLTSKLQIQQVLRLGQA